MAATALRMGVVGGSIAGCAMAIAGLRAGADVTVYERSNGELQDRGLGIVIPPALHQELVSARYLDASMETAPVGARVWVTRKPDGRTAHEFGRQPSAVVPCNWGMLWRSLRSRAGDVRYHRGLPVTSVEREPSGGALIRTAAGVESYDIVVGADGHQSVTRELLAPGLRPTPAGYVVWRGTVSPSAFAGRPEQLELLRGAWVTVAFPRGHGVFYLIPTAPKRAGGAGGERLLAYAIYGYPPAPAAGRRQEDVATYVRTLADEHFPVEWADVVARGEHLSLMCHPVADIQVPRAADPPFLLAGDAAAITRPHTASGAVKALQDALCLERVLRDSTSTDEALRRYADERTAAGAHLVELGRRLGRAQVERTPEWHTMGPADVDTWSRAVLDGATSYLFGGLGVEVRE
ncbi:FAD-dependent monooxygenase [Streptomyces sp. NPDC058620]|uniref:FAD-dependent monooxygenase n=1 Tax=Streptomyces sp. NPDC058620 TaxID=3346560 RepID=UPI00366881A3